MWRHILQTCLIQLLHNDFEFPYPFLLCFEGIAVKIGLVRFELFARYCCCFLYGLKAQPELYRQFHVSPMAGPGSKPFIFHRLADDMYASFLRQEHLLYVENGRLKFTDMANV